MKNFYTFIIALFVCGLGFGQTTIFSEDFETDGDSGIRYTSSNTFNDGVNDHFDRTNGSGISGTYNMPNNSFFWAGEDLDDNGGDGSPTKTITFNTFNINGYTNLTFKGLFASGNGGSGWDSSDELYVEYSIDGGSFQKLIQFASPSSGSNVGLNHDPNLDGIGEGNSITTTFTEYSASIGATGNTLQLRVFARANSASEEFAFDNFIVEGIATSSNDADTDITAPLLPSTQVAATTITAATTTTSATAEDVFGFEVQDLGTADGLPTNITTMRFVPGPNNTADWSDHIQGITLLDGNVVPYTPTTTTISDTEIVLDFATPITVADGTTLEFLLGIYLNTTNIEDGSIIQLQINAGSSGFIANTSGSGFAALFSTGDIVGNNITVDVDASELRFTAQPSDVTIGAAMSPNVEVAYTDSNGNIDTDYDGSGFDISLTTSGSFDAAATTTATAANGIASFSNLVFDALGTGLILTATDVSTLITGTYDSNTFEVTTVPIGAVDLFFSEYIEGSSNNKYLEIYNGTGASVVLTDYSVELYANGASSPTNTEDFTSGFPASLADGEVIVLQNSSASIYAGTTYNSTVCNFNGDDAIVLKKGGVIIDIIGNIGCDPGSSWSDTNNSTQNETLVRNSDICEGISTDPVSSCPFPTLDSEWTSFSIDNVSNLGSHTANCGPTTYTFDSGIWSPSDPNGSSLSSEIIIIEAGDAVISQNTDINTVTVNPGASLTINSGITLTVADATDGLTLESSSASFSSLIRNGTITGTINYERYVDAIGSGNDLVSVPLTSFLLDYQEFLGFGDPENRDVLATNGANTLHLFGDYDNTNLVYNNYQTYLPTAPPDPAAPLLVSGKGYRAATTSGSTITFTGEALNTDVSIDIDTPTAVVNSQWNLIGNPYPSYLDAATFLSVNGSLFESGAEAIYAYNSDTYTGGAATASGGNFTVINAATITMFPAESFNVAPGQGFFVAADTPMGTSETVNFRGMGSADDMRTTSGSDDYIAGRNSSTGFAFKLGMMSNGDTANTTFFFMDNTTRSLDPGYDAGTFGGSNLYSHLVENNTGRNMALQALPLDDLNDVVIPLGVNANQGQQVNFNIAYTTLPETIEVYLEDNVANTVTLLNDMDYVLTPNVNLNGTGRFFLRFFNSTLSNPQTDLDNLSIYTDQSDKTIVIAGQLIESTVAEVYDLQGRLVAKQLLNTLERSQSIDTSSFSTGVYVVQLQYTAQNKTQKVIIR